MVDAVVSQNVTQVPEFLDDFVVCLCYFRSGECLAIGAVHNVGVDYANFSFVMFGLQNALRYSRGAWRLNAVLVACHRTEQVPSK